MRTALDISGRRIVDAAIALCRRIRPAEPGEALPAPDFVAQALNPVHRRDRVRWFVRCADEAAKQGATYHRFSEHEAIAGLLLYEGWKTMPEALPPPAFQPLQKGDADAGV
jgi:hypothetical protein